MKKFKQLKQAVRNTSPDRLAKIEYQSHFMQMLGVSAVCSILIFKGFWWIIFAFIFSLGVSFSQYVSSYQRYHAIKDIVGDTYDVKKDKSFTRRRDYIINQVFGWWMKWALMVAAVVITLEWIPYNTVYSKVLFAFFLLLLYFILYFFVAYWVANKFFKEKKK